MTFDDIRKGGLLLYEYTRGSHAYHLDMETSDIDTGGVFCEPVETLLGIGGDNTEEVSDARHDTTWYDHKNG